MGENRQQLHELRRKAHEAGIQGNSKMTVEQLKTALNAVKQGKSPEQARAAALEVR